MVKNSFQILFILLSLEFIYSQEFHSGLTTMNVETYGKGNKNVESHFVYSLINSDSLIINGTVTSIFHEQVDSACIFYSSKKNIWDSLLSTNGQFRLKINEKNNDGTVELKFKHPDYYLFDTVFSFSSASIINLSVQLVPKYKISLRGRVFSGSLPLEGVDVEISKKGETYKLQTLGCYTDEEDYWNCLYNGMFRQEIVLDNKSDSIHFKFEKEGLKPLLMGMTLEDYTGDIMEVKMKYASKIAFQPKNCLGIKIAFPFTTLKNNWFIDLFYYYTFEKKYFDRVSVGVEGNFLITSISKTYNTFPGQEATFDTSYISTFIGPSALFWLRRPENRYFSTYAGLTGSIEINDGRIGLQPFIGTRIFADINKAISLEIRHVSYRLNVAEYSFNPYGNSIHNQSSEIFNDLIIDIGLQIVF